MEEKKNKKKPLFRLLVSVVRIFYKKRKFVNSESLSEEVSIYVSNHAQLHGPLAYQLLFPKSKKIWCIGEVMKLKTAPKYMFEEFWSNKPKSVRWIYKIFSYVFSPFASYIFSNADTIAVYKDNRSFSTFKNSIKALKEGNNVIIFPERHETYNNIVNEFDQNFVYLAKMYYKLTKQEINFVPMYNAHKLKTIVFGKPFKYDSSKSVEEQKESICSCLKEEITSLARSLPCHTVVPYENMRKKDYPKSI